MFVAIFIICLLNSGKHECVANVGRSAPFYTKKECVLASEAKHSGKVIQCIKIGNK